MDSLHPENVILSFAMQHTHETHTQQSSASQHHLEGCRLLHDPAQDKHLLHTISSTGSHTYCKSSKTAAEVLCRANKRKPSHGFDEFAQCCQTWMWKRLMNEAQVSLGVFFKSVHHKSQHIRAVLREVVDRHISKQTTPLP